MSMPSFRECEIEITREQALNMILASIAMEELALGHIINAEGEKLQYILGTLENGHDCCASTDDILRVNKSVTCLLDTVMQNQIILKGKMEKVLNEQICKEEPCSKQGSCIKKGHNNILLTGYYPKYCWKRDEFFPWRNCSQLGSSISLNGQDPSIINLAPARQYRGQFSLHVRVNPDITSINLSIQGLGKGSCQKLSSYTYYNTEKNKCIVALTGEILIPCESEHRTVKQIALMLSDPESLYVDQAVFSITE